MEIEFNLDSNPQDFFDILPLEWKEEIEDSWPFYESFTNLYTILSENTIIAGGLVFAACPKDMEKHQEVAENWFSKGYLYIGFLFVHESFRNYKLGSTWLKELKNRYPDQNYWLTVEEEGLIYFYQKNGFVLETELVSHDSKEWLLSYTSNY